MKNEHNHAGSDLCCDGKQIVINNYCPVGKSQLYVACAVVFATSLVAAVPMHFAGLWLIWPFSVLTVLAVLLVLRYFVPASDQVVSISGDTVKVYADGTELWSSMAYWTRVVLRKRPHPWNTDHIFLRSHGKEIEIGVSRKDRNSRETAQFLANSIYHSTQYEVEQRS